jgi:hypothetical protein
MAMDDTERMATPARALHEAAGTITGHSSEAGGEGARDMLTDVRRPAARRRLAIRPA